MMSKGAKRLSCLAFGPKARDRPEMVMRGPAAKVSFRIKNQSSGQNAAARNHLVTGDVSLGISSWKKRPHSNLVAGAQAQKSLGLRPRVRRNM